MLILEVADVVEPANPWTTAFFYGAVFAALGYFGWQIAASARAKREQKAKEAGDASE